MTALTEPGTEPAVRIIEAADTLFTQQGYDGVSMRDIARRAGVNKASVFYYFNTKDELFEKVLDRYYVEHRRALEEAFAVEGRIDARLHHVVDVYMDFIQANVGYPRLVQGLLLSEARHLPLIQKGIGSLFEWTQDVLATIAPTTGPKSSRQLFVTIAGAVMNYFVYAPALAEAWGDEPLSSGAVAERRAHLHWLVDRILSDVVP